MIIHCYKKIKIKNRNSKYLYTTYIYLYIFFYITLFVISKSWVNSGKLKNN